MRSFLVARFWDGSGTERVNPSELDESSVPFVLRGRGGGGGGGLHGNCAHFGFQVARSREVLAPDTGFRVKGLRVYRFCRAYRAYSEPRKVGTWV